MSVYIGFAKESYFEQRSRGSFQAQMKIEPTQLTDELTRHVIKLFRKHYKGEAVRQIGVQYSQFIPEALQSISLFDNPDTVRKSHSLQHTIDDIRRLHGFLAIQKASVLLDSSRAIARSKLIGGHAAGGAGGLDGLV